MRSVPAPKKSLGQHFLINDGITRRICALLEPEPEDQILEIGPGPGALTRYLLAAPHARLLVIEKDDWWAAEHGRQGQAEVLCMDALNFDWAGLEGKWKLAGNLPYNIASPLIWNILTQTDSYERAVFMVQKEVAQRLCAAPNSRQYGALSVWAQCHAFARLEFMVAPGSFRPPPKVDSAVVSFTPRTETPQYPEQLRALLNICFQRRRKQLGGILKPYPALAEGLRILRLDAHLRPESLACADFLNLASHWANYYRIPSKT